MKMETLQNYIKQNEGLRLKPYLCSKGKLTIGYGRNLDDRGITTEEAMLMLINDIQIAIVDLYRIFNNDEVVNGLSNNRQMVLIDMMLNLGATRFSKFKQTIRAVKKNDYNRASDEILDSKYARKDVPNRAKRNADIMRKG